MSVQVAYATIIVVWSTTPLGISWSNEGVTPFAAIAIRMFIAATVGLLVLRLLKISLTWNKKSLLTYSYSLLGIYAALTLTYIAAQYVPSGVISVIYALSPVMSTLLASLLMGKADFTLSKWVSFCLSFFGLALIFFDDWALGGGVLGLLLLVLAVFLYSLGGILVQKIKLDVHPLSITVGTLLMSLPLFFINWLIFDGNIPVIDIGARATWAIIYLGIFGSLLGFACYFYIVKELGATAVTMVTLMTPVIALTIGNILNGEEITELMVVGTAFVLLGLVFYYSNGSFVSFKKPILGKKQT